MGGEKPCSVPTIWLSWLALCPADKKSVTTGVSTGVTDCVLCPMGKSEGETAKNHLEACAAQCSVPAGRLPPRGAGRATDQQVQAVQVGLDVVGVLGGHTPKLLQLRAPCLPDDHGEGDHPLDALLDVAPLEPCGGHGPSGGEAAAGPSAPSAGGGAPETLCTSSEEEKWYRADAARTP